ELLTQFFSCVSEMFSKCKPCKSTVCDARHNLQNYCIKTSVLFRCSVRQCKYWKDTVASNKEHEMTTITHEHIQALHDAAGQTGDLLQAALCQIAMDGEADPRTLEVLSDGERVRIAQYDQESAIEECERVIAEAAARVEGCGACFDCCTGHQIGRAHV